MGSPLAVTGPTGEGIQHRVGQLILTMVDLPFVGPDVVKSGKARYM